MSNLKTELTNKKPQPLNESGTRNHDTPSATKLESKNPPKAK